jgi:phosphoribosylamine--glycine ligase
MSSIAPTRTLVVGGGGREHALAWKLASEPGGNEVIVAPGSQAIGREPRVRCVEVDPLDPSRVVAVARHEAVELVVIGPEGPLATGVADALREAGIPVFGPSRAAARIESSKAFCHEVADAAGVRMAAAGAFRHADAARAFAAERASSGHGVVVKADGLAAGKGVTVCDSLEEAEQAIDLVLRGDASATVVIEERVTGREASVIALCDGRDAVALPPARDHKRLLDGDAGPNTGGMGAYSPLDDLPDDEAELILDAFHRPVLAELARRGSPFRGALYAGLMLTADGPVLLECNARFGDPETQTILPRLAVALGPLLLAAARGTIRAAMAASHVAGNRLPTLPGATVSIVLAADGYPGEPRRGDPIEGLDATIPGVHIFHSGTAIDPDGTVRTAGGRVLTVVGRGRDLAEARASATAAADRIRAPGLQRRRDIGLVPVASGAGR